MPRSLKPPRGIFIATQVIFHPDLPPSIKDTLLRLMALAWASGGRYTPPLSYPQLAELTGHSMRTIYAHLSELRNRHAALRLQRAADGNMIIVFNETFLPAKKPSSNCKSLHLPDQEEEEEEINPQDDSLPPPDDHDSDHDHSAEKLQNSAKTLQNSAKTPRLSAQFAAELRAAGVFASLMGEIAASGRTEEDLRALLAWVRDERPESPATLFIARMRAGACAPARFYQPPCPHCGKYGGHAEDCTGKPSRFLGQYADYLED